MQALAQIARRGGAAAKYLSFTPEIAAAVESNSPIVALESTIISHGMPWPDNASMACDVEDIVRKEGATPATIAIVGGKLCVGLEEEQLTTLAKNGPRVRKCSTRDIASTLASGPEALGATTVAATMAVAHAAGISVFATGGIGGVHRGAETTFDVSADLLELSRTPVAVICAGVKSILDIAKTLEYLETHGVPVVTYGAKDFPAFFTPSSGLASPTWSDSLTRIASGIHIASELGYQHGHVVAVPNPSPADGELIEAAIQRALREADENLIAGRDVTPFLLKRVNELSTGNSLKSNIALVKNNAAVGARLAVELSKMKRAGTSTASFSALPASPGSGRCTPAGRRSFHSSACRRAIPTELQRRPVIVGGAVADILCKPAEGVRFELHSSNPGSVTQSWGGVGRNVTEVMARMGTQPVLVTNIGNDAMGRALLSYMSTTLGVPVLLPTWLGAEGAARADSPAPRTAVYSAALDGTGDLLAAYADMEVFDTLASMQQLTRADVSDASTAAPVRAAELLSTASLVVVDGNVPAQGVRAVAAALCEAAVKGATDVPPLVYEPTSIAKCVRIVQSGALHRVALIKPNVHEVMALAQAVRAAHGLPPLVAEAGEGEDDEQEGEEGKERTRHTAAAVDQTMVTEAVNVALQRAAAAGTDSPAGTQWAQIAAALQSADADGVQYQMPASGAASAESDVLTLTPDVPRARESPAAGSGVRISTDEGEDEDGGGESDSVDYNLLVAAQTVLSEMIRPGGVEAAPLAPSAVQFALQADGQSMLDMLRAAAGVVAPAFASYAAGVVACGTCLEGRKHVVVSCGAQGVLWLSAPPAATPAIADLCLTLPFFSAAHHPHIGMDFALVPAPEAHMRKCTGAGDTLLGVMVSMLRPRVAASEPTTCLPRTNFVAEALRHGLAGAKIAVESDASGSTISSRLTPSLVAQVAADCVPALDHEYA